jgi:hypothetical protein
LLQPCLLQLHELLLVLHQLQVEALLLLLLEQLRHCRRRLHANTNASR